MKLAIILCLIATILVSCSTGKDSGADKLDGADVLIDVRTAGEFNGGHLADALNIAYDEIGGRIAEHAKSKDDRIVLYCRSGHRAGIARQTLLKMGYTDVVNAGSYSTLKRQQEQSTET
jgi:phage shock protein E